MMTKKNELGLKIASKKEETFVILRNQANHEIIRIKGQIKELQKVITFQNALIEICNDKLVEYDKQ